MHYVGNKELKYVVKKGDDNRENKNEVRIYKEINKRDKQGKLIHSDIYDHTPYMYGISKRDGKIFLALEYLGKEDDWHSLLELTYNTVILNTRSPLNEESRLESLSVVLKKVEEAITIFHENGFIHNDIKPENVFVNLSQDAKIKFIDFGFSYWGNDYDTSYWNDNKVSDDDKLYTKKKLLYYGTIDYTYPLNLLEKKLESSTNQKDSSTKQQGILTKQKDSSTKQQDISKQITDEIMDIFEKTEVEDNEKNFQRGILKDKFAVGITKFKYYEYVSKMIERNINEQDGMKGDDLRQLYADLYTKLLNTGIPSDELAKGLKTDVKIINTFREIMEEFLF